MRYSFYLFFLIIVGWAVEFFYLLIKKLFNFDIANLNWKSYSEQYCIGTKIHLMKDDMSKVNACREKDIRWRKSSPVKILLIW